VATAAWIAVGKAAHFSLCSAIGSHRQARRPPRLRAGSVTRGTVGLAQSIRNNGEQLMHATSCIADPAGQSRNPYRESNR
jgi:hypothetical protein